jgi:hypothetical protein
MVLTGDFRQLDPANEDKAACKQIKFSKWTIAMNTCLELNGMFSRHNAGPKWGHILKRFRDGVLLSKDFDIIHS